MKKILVGLLSSVLMFGSVMGMYSPSDADVEQMDDLAIKINTMGNNDPNRLVGIANKIVEILPTLNSNGRVYYVLEWIYDTIDLVIAREREQLAIKIAMMEEAAMTAPTMQETHSDDDMDHSDDMMDQNDMDDIDDMQDDDMDNMDDMDDANDASSMDQMDDDDTMSESSGASIQVDVTGSNFSFSEQNIYVSLGDTVTINFESTEGTHDWKIDEFDAATAVVTSADGVTSVTFVADTLGTFEYYCSVGNHRAQGMVGNLVVE